MMKNILIAGMATIVIIIGIVSISNLGTAIGIDDENSYDNLDKDTPSYDGEVQEVTLKFINYEYIMSDDLIEGVPARIIVDMDSVYGCMRDIVIPSFGVRKYVRESDNVIEFTPDKAGIFNIACSMNMGRGRFNVVDSDGTISDFSEPEPVSVPSGIAGSCGGLSGGGCGCGGYR